jgi:hypothetical protein
MLRSLAILAGLLAVFTAGGARAATATASQVTKSQVCAATKINRQLLIDGLSATDSMTIVGDCGDGTFIVAGQVQAGLAAMDPSYPWGQGGVLQPYNMPSSAVGHVYILPAAGQPVQFPVAGAGYVCDQMYSSDVCHGAWNFPGSFAGPYTGYCSSCTLVIQAAEQSYTAWKAKYVPLSSALTDPTIDNLTLESALEGKVALQIGTWTPSNGGGGNGSGSGSGSSTTGDGAQSGNCKQVAGNWFTQFWPNIEATMTCLFVPDKDWLTNKINNTDLGVHLGVPFQVVDSWTVNNLFGTGQNSLCPSCAITFDFTVFQPTETFKSMMRFIAWWTVFFWVLRYLGLPVVGSARAGFTEEDRLDAKYIGQTASDKFNRIGK